MSRDTTHLPLRHAGQLLSATEQTTTWVDVLLLDHCLRVEPTGVGQQHLAGGAHTIAWHKSQLLEPSIQLS